MHRLPIHRAVLFAASAALLSTPVHAIGTALTYQGSLEEGGQPANGLYDLLFELQDAVGVVVGPVLSRDDVTVTGGVFTVVLDFGATAFTGPDRFLRVSVRPGAATGNYTALNPPAAVTATPYTQLAEDANFAATVANGSVNSLSVADNSLGRVDLATASVSADELTDNAVSTSKLVDGAVTNAKLAAGSVSGDRLAPNGVAALAILDESLTSADIGPNAIGLTEVKSAEVQLRVSGSCAAGSAVSAINVNGSVNCADLDDLAWSTAGNSVTGSPFLGTTNPVPLVLRANNKRIALFQHDSVAPSVLLGFESNAIAAGVHGATIAGGGNASDPDYDAPGPNLVLDSYGFIGGGVNNIAGSSSANADSVFATVAGGQSNRAAGIWSAVGGGRDNLASGSLSAIGGGIGNNASGGSSAIGGGTNNCAGGANSWAGGQGAKIRPGANSGPLGAGCIGFGTSPDADGDRGTFVWADSTLANFSSTGSHQFLVRAQGGMALNTAPPDGNVELTVASDADGPDYANFWLKQRGNSSPGLLISVGDGTSGNNNAAFYLDHYNGTAQARRMALNNDGSVVIRSNITAANTGVTMAANAGSWSSLSDRNAKIAIEPVDPHAVLAGVAALPLSTWSYRAQGEGIRHMGPMAQDFAAAFGLGEDDTHISTVDIDGVALAAIQGLNTQLQDARSEIAELEDRLARLEAAVARSDSR